MRRCEGFTLIELMVVIAIIGIMSVTAVPLYRTYQQRAYGSEAALMIKQILDAQIIYFLAHNEFFPEFGQSIEIYHDGGGSSANGVARIKDALNITIPVGHFLDYYIVNMSGGEFEVTISSHGDFPLFKDGSTQVTGKLDENGGIAIY